MRFWRRLTTTALVCAALGGTASAQTLAPEAFVPALTVYLKGLAELRATALACASDAVTATEAADWDRAQRVLGASLSAKGYPGEFLATLPDLLAEPAGTPDCTDEARVSDARLAVADWTGYLSSLFRHLEVNMIANPPPAESWAEIEALFDAEVPETVRLVGCVEAVMPTQIVWVVGDWNQQLLDIGRKLIVAGYPRAAVVARLDAADTNAIWQPADAEALNATRTACLANPDWMERLYRFDTFRLSAGIDAILNRTTNGQIQ